MKKKIRTTRRDFLKWCAAGSAAAAAPKLSLTRTVSAKENRPNIVLIVADDHGTDALGCYGNPVIRTPHLDGLAAEGVRFSHAFCTTASCSPSRSVILTGLQNHSNGQYGLQHDYHHFQTFDHIKSLPHFLIRSRYRTARIGKFHVAPDSVYPFDKVLSTGRANDAASIGRSPVQMVEQCTEFIADRDPRPFFLYFCVDDPHRGQPFDTRSEPNAFGNRVQGYPGVTPVVYDPREVLVPAFLPDLPECRAELAQYYQSVSRLDQGIGNLVRILKKADRYDNTLIVYISDNGMAFPGAKTTLYDPGMRLPCIVRAPGLQKRGLVNPAMISWTDLTPTLLDFAGSLPDESHFHGRSFKPILEEDNPEGWDEVYASHTFHEVTMYYPMRAVRTRRYKLIRNLAYRQEFPFAQDLQKSSTWQSALRNGIRTYGRRPVYAFLQRSEFELYDLDRDPFEIQNAAADPDHAPILQTLQQKLHSFQERTMDPWIADGSAPERWKTYLWPK